MEYAEYAKHREEERAIKRKRYDRAAIIVAVVSTTIGVLLLVIGTAGYLVNTELVIEPDDFYGAVGFAGGLIVIFGNLIAVGIKWN